MKKNITEFDGALSKISQLPIKTYFYDNEKYAYMHFSDKRQYGVMAQDLESIFPEMVMDSKHAIMGDDGELTDETLDIKTVNYDQLIPVLIRAVQEQQEMIDELKLEIQNLKNQ